MLKRLLLVLSLFVGGTAFAAGVPYIVNGNNTSNNYGYIPLDNNVADCADIPLTWHGETGSGTFTLTADWTPDVCPLYFDPNIANGGADIASNKNIENEFFDMAWAQYGVGSGDGGIYSECNSSSDDVDAQGRFTCRYYNELSGKWSVNNNGLEVSALPTGKSVAINWNLNVPSGVAAAPVPASYNPQTTQLIFMGFYEDPNGPNNVAEMYLAGGITQIGNKKYLRLSSYGEDAAKLIHRNADGECENNIWYAQWGCVKPTVPTAPVLDGWEFEGWYDAAEGGKKLDDNTCIMGDQTYYAHWTQTTFDCPSEFKEHDVTPVTDTSTQCYKWETPQCDQQNGRNPANCTNVKWANCACDGVRYKVFANGTIVPEGGDAAESCTKTEIISAEPIDENHYWDATTQTCPAYDHVSYYCESPTEETALTTNNARHNYPYTLQSSSIADNCANATNGYEFDKWNCKLKSAPAVVAMQPFTAGSTEQSWSFDGDVDCVATWMAEEYNIVYNVVMGNNIYATKNGVNTDEIVWPEGNLDVYFVSSNFDLTNPTPVNSDNYRVVGGWYECDTSGNPIGGTKTPVENIVRDVAGDLRSLNLCIDMGWPITYVGCYDPNDCRDTEPLNDFVCDPYNLMYFEPGHSVTFPKYTVGDCLSRIDLASDAFDGKWYRKVGAGLFPIKDTSGQSGARIVYAKLQRKYKVTYDCNGDEYGTVTDDTSYSDGATVQTKTGCVREGYEFKWQCSGVSGELVPGHSTLGTFTINQNTSCVAHWTPREYPLTYKCENGTQNASLTSGTYYSGVSVDLWTENGTHTKVGNCDIPSGRSFGGWQCVPVIAQSSNGNSITMQPGGVECSAQWDDNDYTVIYNCNDGSTSVGFKSGVNWTSSPLIMGQDAIRYGNNYAFKVAADTCEEQANKTVSGWNCNVSGTPWNSEQKWTIASDVTCNAIWSNLYNLTYSCGDGGSGDPSVGNGQYAAGTTLATLNVEQSSCVKPNSMFTWDCNGQTIEPGDLITINTNTPCTAVWDDIKYKLEYDCDNGNKGTDPAGGRYTPNTSVSVLTTEQSSCLVPNNTREFDKWRCFAGGVELFPDEGNITMPESDVKCTAHWKDATYHVTYNCADGKVVGSDVLTQTDDIEYGTNYAFVKQEDKCEWTGHTPMGWSCKRTDNNRDISLAAPDYTQKTWRRTYDVVCDANWDTIKYRLDYVCDNGDRTATDGNSPYDAGTSATALGMSACGTKSGYEFKNWNCKPTDEDAFDVDAGGTITMNSDTICTAIWQGEKYSVTYDCNGGHIIDSEGTTQIISDIEYGVTEFAFTKQEDKCEWYAHVPKSWSCKRTDKGSTITLLTSAYTPKTWTRAYSVECVADWDTTEYTLTYNCDNGGKGTEPTGGSYAVGAAVPVQVGSGSCQIPKGTTFKNWNCGSDIEVSDNRFRMPEHNVECKAIWEENINQITYIGCINGDCSNQLPLNTYIDSDKWTYSNTKLVVFPVEEEEPITGALGSQKYHFNGKWYKIIMVSGNEGRFPLSDTRLQSGSLTVYTNLIPYYAVAYDCNGGTGSPVDGNSPYLVDTMVQTLSDSECVRTGYTFVNWECGDKLVDAGNKFKLKADTTCVAQWDNNGYQIKYRGGKAGERSVTQTAMSNQSVKYGEEVSLKKNTFAIEGYDFVGWKCVAISDQDDETITQNYTTDGKQRYPIGAYNYVSDMTCTAQWEPRKYNIVYKNASCDGSEGDVVIEDALTYDSSYELSGVPVESTDMTGAQTYVRVPTGYAFSGWAKLITQTEPDYDAEKIDFPWTSDEPWTTEGDLELYALCYRVPYKIEYDCDATVCDVTTDPKHCTAPIDNPDGHYYNRLVKLKANTCSQPGYTFNSWECAAKNISEEARAENLLEINAEGRIRMPNDDVLCRAKWDRNVYHVTYDCNTDVCDDAESDCVTPYDYEENVGENEEPMLKDYYYNDTVTTKANTCTKTGHKFTKWLCGEEQIAQGGTFNIYNDTTCSAQWEPKHYDIDYYSGNCEGEQSEFVDTDANGLEYGQKFSAIKNIGESAGDIDIEVKSGYKFIGWDTAVVDEETASSESFVPGYVSGKEYGPWMTDNNLTLHAVCVPELYHIYYEHNGGHFNPKIVDSVIGPYTVKTPVNVQKVFVSITDEKPGANNFYYHVFDGWYTDPGFAEGTKVEYVPWADLIDNPRDVTLYAKWLDAGEIEFYCNVGQIQSDKKPENEMITSPDASFHEFDCGVGDSCVFDMWNCDDGRRVGDYEDIEVLKNGETVTCVMSQTCSYPITYHVSKMTYGDETLEPVDSVYVGDTEIAVTDLTPASYTTGTVVTYPIISLPGCEFRGWYDNENFEGNTVTGTPETTAGEEGYAIDVYGKMVCGVYDECQDPEKAHWLRIGDNENDRVCLYEYQQTHPSIKINKRDGSGGYYYLMLSEDPDMLMHNGSAKKMRVNYNDKTYNVCDKSICPELAQPEP